jgi:DNA-binding response OmpR family regulator
MRFTVGPSLERLESRVSEKLVCTHGDAPLISGSSVLIVDRSAESREVLRIALARHGVRVLECTRATDGLAMARLYHSEVMVLDLDSTDASDRVAEEFAVIAEDSGAALLVLGNELRARGISSGEFIAKPYQYKPLILRIEESLRQRRRQAAA